MEKSEYDQMYELEDIHWWFLGKREFLKSLIPKFRPNPLILDVGAGTGGVSKWLESFGSVTRIEPSDRAIKYLQKRKLTAICQPAQKCDFKPNTFGMIICADVLYHRQIDDKAVIALMVKWLAPGGTLIIVDCAMPFLYGYHDLVMHGRERYTRNELSLKTNQAGLVIQKSSYLYFFTFIPFVISRWFQNIFRIRAVTSVPTWLNNLLFSVCRFEGKLLKNISFPIGSSVCVIAQKSV